MKVDRRTILLIGIGLMLILTSVSILPLVQIAGASYSFSGVPYADKLDLIAHGTFRGAVYVGESRGLGFPPYTQTFDLPPDVKVKWADCMLVFGVAQRDTKAGCRRLLTSMTSVKHFSLA